MALTVRLVQGPLLDTVDPPQNMSLDEQFLVDLYLKVLYYKFQAPCI
jgi:hypothetical protein